MSPAGKENETDRYLKGNRSEKHHEMQRKKIIIYLLVYVWGGGGGGGGNKSETEMNFCERLISPLQFVFFIHRVLVILYFKNRCVNNVLPTFCFKK